MFFHIFVETTDKQTIGLGNKQIFETELLSLDNIVDNVLIPYLLRDTIQIKGFLLRFDQIQRLLVKKSYNKAEQIAKENSRNLFPLNLIFPYNAKEMIKWDNFTEDITAKAFKLADDKLKLISYNPSIRKTLDRSIIYIGNMTIFNQQNQQVTNQNNAGHDISIYNYNEVSKHNINSKEDFCDELRKLQSRILKARDTGVLNIDIADNIDREFSCVIQETKKPEPKKNFIIEKMKKSKDLLKDFSGVTAFATAIINLIRAIKNIKF